LLPAELRTIKYCKGRIVTDYISGMMDSFAIQEYEKYFGKGSSEKLYFK
jgi:dGTP triphosphohydrolase